MTMRILALVLMLQVVAVSGPGTALGLECEKVFSASSQEKADLVQFITCVEKRVEGREQAIANAVVRAEAAASKSEAIFMKSKR